MRNAVEAAVKMPGWSNTTAHNRAQVLYYIAENLAARRTDFVRAHDAQLCGLGRTGCGRPNSSFASQRIFTYAAMADKYDGHVHATPLAMSPWPCAKPLGVIGIVAPEEAGLIGLISTVMPALAMGNRVVVVPSLRYALLATDFYQVLDTSDLPGGALNIVTGDQAGTGDRTWPDITDLKGCGTGVCRGSQLVEEQAARYHETHLGQPWPFS